MASGLLFNTAKTETEEFTRSCVDVTMRGAVVAGGYCLHQDALEAASDYSLRGLILSSISSHLIGYVQQLAIPVILLEGFGAIPFNPLAFQLLEKYDRNDASSKRLRMGCLRGKPSGSGHSPTREWSRSPRRGAYPPGEQGPHYGPSLHRRSRHCRPNTGRIHNHPQRAARGMRRCEIR